MCVCVCVCVYAFTHGFIKTNLTPQPSQKSERSCIYVSGLYFLSLPDVNSFAFFFYNLALRRVQKQILRILKHLTFVNKEVTFE